MLKNKNFFSIYSKELIKKINNLNLDILEEITHEIFNNIKLKRKIFVCGNGGSAAVANHFICDFNNTATLFGSTSQQLTGFTAIRVGDL